MKRTAERTPDQDQVQAQGSSAPGPGGSLRTRAQAALGNRGLRRWLRETLRPEERPADPLQRVLDAHGRSGGGGGPPVLPPDDPLEREAERAAERAAGSAAPRTAGATGPAAVEELGQRFGRDFGGVRVHDGALAAEAARDLGARAFTLGRDVYLGAGERTSTPEGRRLLAHELTHVVQQGAAPPRPGGGALPVAGRAPAQGAIARAVSPRYPQIKKNLTYRFTDWAITDREAREVVSMLVGLGDPDFQDTIQQMEADGLVERLLENIPDEDRARDAAVIQRIQGARSTGGIKAEIEDLMSYGILDWAVTFDEARRALETLKDLSQANPAKFKQVARRIEDKYFARFLDALSVRDKFANREFLDELQIVRATGMTRAEARQAMEAYKALPEAERKRQFERDHPTGRVAALLRALGPQEAADNFRDEVGQLLRWTEEAETRKAAGMDDAAMAKLQSEFMAARRKKTAEKKIETERKKAQAEGKPVPAAAPPTAESLKEAHQANVAESSVQKKSAAELEFEKKKDDEKKRWEERGKAVIAALVKRIQAKYPELKLTQANFLAEFEGIEARGKHVFAMGRPVDGVRVCVFGQSFVENAEADPDYVMATVVHEIFGHPEFGIYGQEYHLKLYDEAAAQMAGYTKPTGDARTSEIDNFAYHGTEIYAELRSAPYEKEPSAKHRKKGLTGGGRAVDSVRHRLRMIKKNWDPKLSPALARGLYQRFRSDPRLTAGALKLYERAVREVFRKEADAILK